MADTFSKEKRHEIMSNIKSKETKIEIKARLWLFNKGLRYRKNNQKILGKPDISIQKYMIAIFINGCFWHGHVGCRYNRTPKTNQEYWTEKIRTNINRDEIIQDTLRSKGWHVFVLWECELNSNFEFTLCKAWEDIVVILSQYKPKQMKFQ